MLVYEIPEQNLDKLTDRFNKMVNRAKKCKGIAPTFSIIHEYDEVGKNGENVQRYLYITLDGELPKVKGWEFVATIDHTNETGNIIRNVPNQGGIPLSFRTATPLCEHCGHTRKRHETFVLRNVDDKSTYKQVGRNCLADFFDGELADYVVSLTELWESLGEMVEGMGEFSGERTESRYPSTYILALTQEVILEKGWLSRTKAIEQEESGNATSSLVSSLLTLPQYRSGYAEELWKTIVKNREEREEEKQTALEQFAESALEWARSLDPESETTNDYLYNLHTIAKGESVTHKGLGLLCSLIPAYKRVVDGERERAEKASRPASTHLGNVGDRLVFENVTVEWVGQPTYSQWGATTPVKFVDANGNVLMNWSSGESDYQKGEVVSIVGTVKAHAEYQGVAQTVINRIKEWDGKPVKQAKKKKG